MGFYSGEWNEQGGEASHQTYKRSLRRSEHIKEELERYTSAVTLNTVGNLLRLKTLTETD